MWTRTSVMRMCRRYVNGNCPAVGIVSAAARRDHLVTGRLRLVVDHFRREPGGEDGQGPAAKRACAALRRRNSPGGVMSGINALLMLPALLLLALSA